MRTKVVVALTMALLLVASAASAQGKPEKVRWTVSDPGSFLFSCGDFEVWQAADSIFFGIVKYDANGQAASQIIHFRNDGQTMYYNASNPSHFVMGGPGETQNNKMTIGADGSFTSFVFSGGTWKVKLPGMGVIFMETGKGVFDVSTYNMLFNSAHNDYYDVSGQRALCDVLR